MLCKQSLEHQSHGNNVKQLKMQCFIRKCCQQFIPNILHSNFCHVHKNIFFSNLKNQEWHDLQATFLFFIFIFFLCHKRTGNSIKVPRLMPAVGVWRRVFMVKMSGPYSLVGIPGKGQWWQSLMAKTSLLMDELGGPVRPPTPLGEGPQTPGVWVEVAWSGLLQALLYPPAPSLSPACGRAEGSSRAAPGWDRMVVCCLVFMGWVGWCRERSRCTHYFCLCMGWTESFHCIGKELQQFAAVPSFASLWPSLGNSEKIQKIMR